MKQLSFVLIGIVINIQLFGQSSLDEYIQQGLDNNLVLKQRNINVRKAHLALQQAKANFRPQVNFEGQYTYGIGGRQIDLPIGDLLNNVYATLNQLTASENFPQVKNVSEYLNPYNFYDVKVAAQMPLYNRDIIHNKRIKERQISMGQQEVGIYKRDLIRDIKTAYYNFLMANAELRIYESAVQLAERNVEVNEALLKNGKALPAQVIRAKSERENLRAKLEGATANRKNAQAYFNFLINAPLEQTVPTDFPAKTLLDSLVAQTSTDIENREELQLLRTAVRINEEVVEMKEDYWIPQVNAFLNLGMQEFNFEVNEDAPYVLGGFQVKIPIYGGQQNQYAIQQAKLDQDLRSKQLSYTQQQLQLASTVAHNKLDKAYRTYLASQDQLRSAESYYKLIEKGYRAGVNSQIEFIDAQNQLNTSRLQQNIAMYQIFVEAAEVERQNAGYPIENR